MGIYESLLKPILFRFDPEHIHDLSLKIGAFLGSNILTRGLVGFACRYKHPALNLSIDGHAFDNPVGLAAGFDKNAKLLGIIPSVGFGFHEVGSVTAQPCAGNPKPRLFRLPKDNAIAVYYGLCNDGSEVVYERLKNKRFRIPLFVSIAKTNDQGIRGDASVADYYRSYLRFRNLATFIVINISCPNSGDGRSFEDHVLLEKLLKKIGTPRNTIFLKVSPDLSKRHMDALIALATKYGIRGFVISNLSHDTSKLKTERATLARIKGGISGPVVKSPSNDLIRYVYKKTNGSLMLIGVGGISSAEDAYERIKNGATLVQLITGMIYYGPGLIKKINKGLVKLMEQDGYSGIQEVVGVDAKRRT